MKKDHIYLTSGGFINPVGRLVGTASAAGPALASEFFNDIAGGRSGGSKAGDRKGADAFPN